MVKRKTNFKQVYLVDKYILDLQKGNLYLHQKQHFDDFNDDKSLETHKNKITLPPAKNLQSIENTNATNLTSVNSNNVDTQTTNFDDIYIPNEYFLNDSFTQTNSKELEDAYTQTDYQKNMHNFQINEKNKNDANTQTQSSQQSYSIQRITPTQKSYICQICNQIFNHPKAFSNHLKVHKGHNKPRSKDKRFNNTSGGDKGTAYLKLNKSLASTKRFVDGRNIHDWKNQYLCKICNIKLRTYSSLKSHVNSLHRSRRIRFEFPNNSNGEFYFLLILM